MYCACWLRVSPASTGRYKLATEDLTRALQLDPQFTDAQMNLQQIERDVSARHEFNSHDPLHTSSYDSLANWHCALIKLYHIVSFLDSQLRNMQFISNVYYSFCNIVINNYWESVFRVMSKEEYILCVLGGGGLSRWCHWCSIAKHMLVQSVTCYAFKLCS